MTDSEHYEYLCSIFTKLVPCDEITGEELADLASSCGVKIKDFYYQEPEILEVINWNERRAA